jgi:hypothetical protein
LSAAGAGATTVLLALAAELLFTFGRFAEVLFLHEAAKTANVINRKKRIVNFLICVNSKL